MNCAILVAERRGEERKTTRTTLFSTILIAMFIGALAFAFNVRPASSESSAPLLWNYATGRRVYTVSVSSNNKYVVAGSDDGNVYCLDLATGQRIWNYDTVEGGGRVGISIFDVCISPDNNYTIAGTASNIYCFNTTSGKKEWNFTTGEREVWSVFVTSNNKYVIAGSFDNDIYGNGHIYCLDITDGTLKWAFQTGYVFSVFVSLDNQYILAGGASGVTALDINGNLLWNYCTNGDVSQLFVSPDTRYVIAADIGTGYSPSLGHIYALNITNGQQIWNFSAIGTPRGGASNIPITSVFVSSNGKSVVAGDGNGELYYLDVNDGHLIWHCSAYDYIYDVSISSNGKYVVGGGVHDPAGGLICLNSTDGSELWNYTLANTGGMWSVSISSDSKYIVGGAGYGRAGGGSIYVFYQALGLTSLISPLSASILAGQSLIFTSTVLGGYTPYNYQWYLNGSAVSGASLSSWTFAPQVMGNYSVYLNVTDSLGNSANSNQVSVTVMHLLGDLNNDGTVDMKDISIAARAFGSSPGNPRWNPLADVNHDGKVDIKDIALIAKHFGEHL